jgi:hypothetical protein
MTERSSIEDRVRQTLRTVAEQPIPPAGLFFDSAGASERRRLVRLVGAVLIVAAVAVALVLALIYGPDSGSGTPGPASVPHPNSTSTHVTKLPNTTLTPKGWSPLSVGTVQISVPSTWYVQDGGGIPCDYRDTSYVFIDQTPYSPDSEPKCPAPINVVELSAASKIPLPRSRRATLNSIQVTESRSSSPGSSRTTEVVRALGMQLLVKGPMAAEVVATLTRSPLSVVIGSSVSSIPAGWQQIHFGGIHFAVPRQWRITQSTSSAGCPFSNIKADVLALSTAQVPSDPSCLDLFESAGSLEAQPGMALESGPQVRRVPVGARCLRRNGLRICVDPPPSPTGAPVASNELNLLTAQIFVPKQRATDQIEIGLTGRGITPLEIFDSMRPATSGHS